ncbi:RlpA-like double-psi beta-barrel-protein domain-containing protein-containing protein [Haematococcus lacustris]
MPQLRSPCDAPERSEWPLSSGRLVHPRPLSQSSPASIFALLTLLLAVPASAQWKVGRATWYDDAAWMSVHSGSCMYGYLGNKFGGNQNWMVAAMNDGHPRFGGSCGRCYKIRCKPMTVRDNYGQQIDRNHECYNQDPVTVVITDNCPCHYPNNAYSNKRWCCGDMDHFDLGIWAFKKFADPGKGVVGIEYHETPCPADFQQPLNPSVQKPSSLLRQYPHDLDAQHAAAKAFGQKVVSFSGPPDNAKVSPPSPSSSASSPSPSPSSSSSSSSPPRSGSSSPFPTSSPPQKSGRRLVAVGQ